MLLITVLIVAKCIVNFSANSIVKETCLCINSSKVYCKSGKQKSFNNGTDVLIVAKCIVNKDK